MSNIQEKIDLSQTNKTKSNSSSSYTVAISILLIFLYSLQGLVLGFFLETIQVKLKKDFSFAEIGVFALCTYPFSLKVLWSPIVDTYYIKFIGLRRTWAISTQLICAGILIFMSYNINLILQNKQIYELSFICFVLVFFIATQDIAIDGWATTLCGKDNCSLASTCQTIGQIIGIIFSTSIYMSLSSDTFCHKFLNKKTEGPYLNVESYLMILAIVYIFASVILLFIDETPFQNLRKSSNEKKNDFNEMEENLSLKETLIKINNAFKNKFLRGFIGILLISKIGHIFFMKLTGLILIEKGLSQENLTNLSSIMTIVEILISIKFSTIKKDFLKEYLRSNKSLFLIFGIELMIVIAYDFYKEILDNNTFIFFSIILVHSIFKTYYLLICFISVSGFFHKITDRSIGATYITALNSSNNLAQKWPGIFIYSLLDYLDYKLIGCLSILYCISFYFLFKNKLIEYDESDDNEWLSFKIDKENKKE